MFNAKTVKQQLVEWIKDYFKTNACSQTKAIIGISGGKDSSVVAALCKEALGKERVLGVLMPQGEQWDIDVARALCEELDIPCIEVNIGNPTLSLYDEIAKTGLKLNDNATSNTPARIRMTTLYAVSAIVGGRVANTCNLSESWVGYSTKFGDAAGDFSPLSQLTVSEIKLLGKELGLAHKFTDKTPEDGLSGKTDEENLGFSYDVLDKYIREKVCEDTRLKNEIDRRHEMSFHKSAAIPSFKV
ncbi:MAG: NAD(+) synthase [Oscillospiraceae bacterium]|nr:NAD(+) synthase [Oscillospiraceae bacterium]